MREARRGEVNAIARVASTQKVQDGQPRDAVLRKVHPAADPRACPARRHRATDPLYSPRNAAGGIQRGHAVAGASQADVVVGVRVSVSARGAAKAGVATRRADPAGATRGALGRACRARRAIAAEPARCGRVRGSGVASGARQALGSAVASGVGPRAAGGAGGGVCEPLRAVAWRARVALVAVQIQVRIPNPARLAQDRRRRCEPRRAAVAGRLALLHLDAVQRDVAGQARVVGLVLALRARLTGEARRHAHVARGTQRAGCGVLGRRCLPVRDVAEGAAGAHGTGRRAHRVHVPAGWACQAGVEPLVGHVCPLRAATRRRAGERAQQNVEADKKKRHLWRRDPHEINPRHSPRRAAGGVCAL